MSGPSARVPQKCAHPGLEPSRADGKRRGHGKLRPRTSISSNTWEPSSHWQSVRAGSEITEAGSKQALRGGGLHTRQLVQATQGRGGRLRDTRRHTALAPSAHPPLRSDPALSLTIPDFKAVSEKPFWPPNVLLLKDFLVFQ